MSNGLASELLDEARLGLAEFHRARRYTQWRVDMGRQIDRVLWPQANRPGCWRYDRLGETERRHDLARAYRTAVVPARAAALAGSLLHRRPRISAPGRSADVAAHSRAAISTTLGHCPFLSIQRAESSPAVRCCPSTTTEAVTLKFLRRPAAAARRLRPHRTLVRARHGTSPARGRAAPGAVRLLEGRRDPRRPRHRASWIRPLQGGLPIARRASHSRRSSCGPGWRFS